MTPVPSDGQPPTPEPWREPWLRDLLRCPVDHAELTDTELAGGAGLACTHPDHRVAYPVTAGVPVLLADDAVPLDPSAHDAPSLPS